MPTAIRGLGRRWSTPGNAARKSKSTLGICGTRCRMAILLLATRRRSPHKRITESFTSFLTSYVQFHGGQGLEIYFMDKIRFSTNAHPGLASLTETISPHLESRCTKTKRHKRSCKACCSRISVHLSRRCKGHDYDDGR